MEGTGEYRIMEGTGEYRIGIGCSSGIDHCETSLVRGMVRGMVRGLAKNKTKMSMWSFLSLAPWVLENGLQECSKSNLGLYIGLYSYYCYHLPYVAHNPPNNRLRVGSE
jgi:hypothetical protein